MEWLDEATFDLEGLEGDAHRGPDSIKQVLLEDAEVLEALDLVPGQIKENVTVRGVGVNALAPGTRLALRTVLLEITKAAGPCHRMEEIRLGLRERLEGCRGALARVLTPGAVRVGDGVVVHRRETVRS